MIAAISEPQVIDPSEDMRLGRAFLNRTINIYPSMTGFFGMEDTIQRVVSYFQHAAQGLEERKQALYLLGPVVGSVKFFARLAPVQMGVAKERADDENNQDISALVGKVDINRTTQRLLEFVKMFKVSIKVLHPLLTATQKGNCAGTQSLGRSRFPCVTRAKSYEFGIGAIQEQQEYRGLPRPHIYEKYGKPE